MSLFKLPSQKAKPAGLRNLPAGFYKKPLSIELKKYRNVDNTIQNMQALVDEFKDDPRLQVFKHYSLKEIFDYIAKIIPYVPDPTPGQVAYLKGDAVELLKSPIQTMFNGGDCDDKSLLAACIFEIKQIPYQFAVVSTKPHKQLHHVYLEILVNGALVPFDATYKNYKLFCENPFTKKKRYRYLNGSWLISDVQPPKSKARLFQPCDNSKTYKKVKSAQLLGTNATTYNKPAMLGAGVQLAILRGADQNFKIKKPRQNYKTSRVNSRILKEGYRNLIRANTLGADPVTTIATVVSVVGSLFGGLFKRDAYIDAFNAWDQAQAQLPGLAQQARTDPAALQALSAVRAMIAVLSRDYMNPPSNGGYGPEPRGYCSDPGDNYYCGNRAKWNKIQPEVEAKTAAFVPFMYYLNKQHVQTNGTPPMDLGSMVSYYDMFKNKSGLYKDFEQSQQSSKKKITAGGLPFSGTGLLLLAAAGAIAFKMKK